MTINHFFSSKQTNYKQLFYIILKHFQSEHQQIIFGKN